MESAPVVDAAVVAVVGEPVELGAFVVVVDPEDVGVEEQAAAVIARPMTRPIRARPRLCAPGAIPGRCPAADLALEVDVDLNMSISELGLIPVGRYLTAYRARVEYVHDKPLWLPA
jgi:hypothetical protein